MGFKKFVFMLALIIIFSTPAQAAEKPVELSTAIVQVARQAIPAVVHIEVTARQEVVSPFLPFENDPFFNVPRTPKKFKREIKGLGTGMVTCHRR